MAELGTIGFGEEPFAGTFSTESLPANIYNSQPAFISGPHISRTSVGCCIVTYADSFGHNVNAELVQFGSAAKSNPTGFGAELIVDVLDGSSGNYGHTNVYAPFYQLDGNTSGVPIKALQYVEKVVPCFIEGANAAFFIRSDGFDSFVFGHYEQSSAVAAHIFSIGQLTGTQSAYVHGPPITSNTKLFVRGRQPITNSKFAFVRGHEDTEAFLGAYIKSIGSLTTRKFAYINTDRFTSSAAKRCYIFGATGTNTSVYVERTIPYLAYINGSNSPRITAPIQRAYIVMFDVIGDWKFDDGIENPYAVTVDDESTIDNDATLYNSPTWIEGPHCG